MPYLILIEEDGGFAAVELIGDFFDLKPGDPTPVRRRRPGGVHQDAILLRHGAGPGESWALLAGPRGAVSVSGVPLSALGIRVLVDRDEIRVGHLRAFFSSERPARTAPYSSNRPIACARCGDPIDPGTPSVVCPRCLVVHHEDAERRRNCWSYAPACAGGCGQTSESSGWLEWSPAGL